MGNKRVASHIQNGQPAISVRTHEVADKGDAKEDEIDLVGLAGEDAHARRLLEHVEAGAQERGGAEVDGERDGDVAHHEGPPADPRRDPAVRRRRQHPRLIVDASSRRVDARDLAQRGGHAQDDE